MLVDFLRRQQAGNHLLRFSVGGDRPYQSFVDRPVLGHTDPKNPGLASWQEVGRLSAVGSARHDRVVWTRWNDEFLFSIAVEVPEHEVERFIGILDPTLEVGRNVPSGRKLDVGNICWYRCVLGVNRVYGQHQRADRAHHKTEVFPHLSVSLLLCLPPLLWWPAVPRRARRNL